MLLLYSHQLGKASDAVILLSVMRITECDWLRFLRKIQKSQLMIDVMARAELKLAKARAS